MHSNMTDNRIPLKPGHIIQTDTHGSIVVDKLICSGSYSLMYLAHVQGSGRFLALKELYPQDLEQALVQRQKNGRITIGAPETEPTETSEAAEEPATTETTEAMEEPATAETAEATEEPATAETAEATEEPAAAEIAETTEASQIDELWQTLWQLFEDEAALTRRASTVYDPNGNQTQQNHPDVPQVAGPFRDVLGNTYLAIDTDQGETLRDYLERGFIKDDDGNVVSNQYLEELLDILTETAMGLSALHAEGLWHLALSPDNIYIVPSAGGTRLVPYIIDYSSAYDRKNPDVKNTHRYTCSLFSAPEVTALAKNGSDGYTPDESSDTYALASILFYGLTGQIFTANHRVDSDSWKEQLHKEYSAVLPSQSTDSFAATLIEFFEQGLAAHQSSRFTGTKALLQALRRLKGQCRDYGNLLPLLDQDELMSYMVLDKHPLYQYKGGDGNIHVLCLGCGAFVRRTILSLISCGQMIGSRLFIHVVSDNPEHLLKEYLCTAAPELELYSNLTGQARAEYVTFSYDHVSDVTQPQVCRDVLQRYPDARYFLISLGSNQANAQAARVYAQGLTEIVRPKSRKAILNYYCSEDASNTACTVAANEFPNWIAFSAFGNHLSSYSKTIRSLGMRTLKVAHLYEKLSNPNIALSETARRLSTNQYSQRSSCAAALHLKYKLASIGINPARHTGKQAIVAAYQKYLQSGKIGALLELEHRRWMMYMISDGYRLPTQAQLQRYGFETVADRFNGSWKCTAKKLHPCLVPCGIDGLALKNDDFHDYTDFAQIEASDFDPLDQTSLRLHLLAKKKCQRIVRSEVIEGYFRSIASRLGDIRSEEPATADTAILYNKLETMLRDIQEDVCVAVQGLCYTGDDDRLAELHRTFDSFGINISDEISNLRKCLSIFIEYAACKDYKAPDDTIIRNLLWTLYADNDITLIKLRGRTIADNITGPLILDPRSLIFFGDEPHPEWNSFLRKHGNRGQITYYRPSGMTVSEIGTALTDIVQQQHTSCVIDITGAGEEAVIAAMRVADANSRVSLIRSTADGKVENIHRFVTAPAYTLHTAIEPDEIFALYGAQEIPNSIGYMEQLENAVPALWEFYREFRKDWTRVTAFFANRGGGSSELWIKNIKVGPDTNWKTYNKKIDTAKWTVLELQAVFQKLTDAGVLQNFTAEEYIPGRMRLSFRYPCMDEGNSDFFRKALDNFFNVKILSIFMPMQCEVRHHPQNGFTIDINSSCRVEIYDRKDPDFSDKRVQPYSSRPRYTYTSIVPALKRLEELRLIADLEISSAAQPPVSIRFVYTNPAVRDCLTVAGNILELYIWREARQTGYFDNVQSNFTFTWKEGVQNELDVIITKGLNALVVSAKTARLNKEHLYEIKYLTEKFSLNSKPVIIYSSDMAYEDGHLTTNLMPVKQRARAMGIWLIDLNETEADLGDLLVQIADGTAPL